MSPSPPTYPQVAARERLLLPPNISDGFLPLHITSINRVITGPQEMQQLSRRYEKEQYIMAMHVPQQAQQPSDPRQQWSGQRHEHQQQGCAEQRRHQEHQQQRQACVCPSAERQGPFAPMQRLWSRSPQPDLRVTLRRVRANEGRRRCGGGSGQGPRGCQCASPHATALLLLHPALHVARCCI